MSWTKKQITLAHLAAGQVGWNRTQYEMVLRNAAGIRPVAGRVSASNPSAGNDGFERFMAMAEVAGFIDQIHGRGHWTACANSQCARLHRKIEALWQDGALRGIVQPDGLPGYCLRMTAHREGGPTRELAECGPVESYTIVEGLKAWLDREIKRRREAPSNA